MCAVDDSEGKKGNKLFFPIICKNGIFNQVFERMEKRSRDNEVLNLKKSLNFSSQNVTQNLPLVCMVIGELLNMKFGLDR